jgi:hypothetical protein
METNILEALKKIGVPDNFSEVTRLTRWDGNSIEWDVLDPGPGCRWKLGSRIIRMKNGGFQWLTKTVENGIQCDNATMSFDAKGKFVKGLVNCFAFGWMKMDVEYVEQFLEEICESPIEWDTTVLQ